MTPEQDPTKKWCSRCQQWKDRETDFSSNKARADGVQNYCKPCASKTHSESVARNRDKVNAAARRKRLAARVGRVYGMTIEEYELLLWDQNDQCPICHGEVGKTPVAFRSPDSIQTEALLCETCGAGLRFFEQSTDRLFRAISFLDSFNVRQTSAVKDESQD